MCIDKFSVSCRVAPCVRQTLADVLDINLVSSGLQFFSLDTYLCLVVLEVCRIVLLVLSI